MAEYQARGWRSWHHNMALVMMAMLFMLEQWLSYKSSHPLLSCQDIISLLCNFLPKRSITSEEVLHHKRKASTKICVSKTAPKSFFESQN